TDAYKELSQIALSILVRAESYKSALSWRLVRAHGFDVVQFGTGDFDNGPLFWQNATQHALERSQNGARKGDCPESTSTRYAAPATSGSGAKFFRCRAGAAD